jgi:hypothetical protein
VRWSTPAGRESLNEPPDVALAALARQQHGVVTIAQLLAVGLNHEAVRRRARDGRLHAVHRGVYAVGHAGLAFEGRCLAAVYACGPGSAASRLTAGELLRVSRWPVTSIAVATVSQRRPVGVEVHRTARLDPLDVTRVRGIPTTTVARTLVDLRDTLTPHQLAYVIHEAAFRHRFDLAATAGRSSARTGATTSTGSSARSRCTSTGAPARAARRRTRSSRGCPPTSGTRCS